MKTRNILFPVLDITAGIVKMERCSLTKLIDLTGKRFGRLVVLCRKGSQGGRVTWKCQCDCGNIAIVQGRHLVSGLTQSCGCLFRERASESNKKHGLSKSRIYGVLESMKTRYYNPDFKNYKHYGGRGIKICPEWLGENGAENFIKWAYENGYDENAKHGKCTIERIDVNGDYEPSNCRWASMKEQSYNKRNNVILDYKGERLTLKEASEKYGINPNLIYSRLNNNWSVEDALQIPPRMARRRPKNCRMISYNGKIQSLAEWCRELQMPYGIIQQRISTLKWSAEKAFQTPIRQRK